jgi:hypothetical protein
MDIREAGVRRFFFILSCGSSSLSLFTVCWDFVISECIPLERYERSHHICMEALSVSSHIVVALGKDCGGYLLTDTESTIFL